MSLVKIKEKHQVTLPSGLREQVGLAVGDWVELKAERGVITLTPKSVVDRHIAEAFEDIAAGRVYGPFSSAKEMIKSLHGGIRRNKASSPKQK